DAERNQLNRSERAPQAGAAFGVGQNLRDWFRRENAHTVYIAPDAANLTPRNYLFFADGGVTMRRDVPRARRRFRRPGLSQPSLAHPRPYSGLRAAQTHASPRRFRADRRCRAGVRGGAVAA